MGWAWHGIFTPWGEFLRQRFFWGYTEILPPWGWAGAYGTSVLYRKCLSSSCTASETSSPDTFLHFCNFPKPPIRQAPHAATGAVRGGEKAGVMADFSPRVVTLLPWSDDTARELCCFKRTPALTPTSTICNLKHLISGAYQMLWQPRRTAFSLFNQVACPKGLRLHPHDLELFVVIGS